MSLIINPYRFGGGGGGGDPYWANVLVSTPLTTDFSDILGHSVTLTGSPVISGGAVDMTASSVKRAQWAEASSGELLITGDFTMEAYVMPSSVAAFAEYFGAGNTTPFFSVRCSNTGRLQLQTGSTRITSSALVSAGARVHMAISRQSGTWYLAMGGVIQGTYAGDTGNFGSAEVHIGANSFASRASIDSFRFTQGVARYTASYTQPSTPYPTS